ncbi:MAG: recombinase family protein [Lachnospiraceae bacterium]|nr:recombinase family protein [Lachnospiraceae bacterium]
MQGDQGIPYQAAAYLRLSRDDEDVDGMGKNESNSIHSQRELIEAFVRRRNDLEIAQIYTDDGYSGTTFERPGFRQMMEDIKAGVLNCVIVKDLSRFGRDYIEAGRYLQKIYPQIGVRFIAVTDCYDSLSADQNDTSLVLPVKNFVNDAYCRDISQKVRSHQRIKRENGAFIGAFTVYGYRKDPADKNHLLPDIFAAWIVRQIYYWKMEGSSISVIASRLNEAGILSPFYYKRIHGEHFQTTFALSDASNWTAVAVERILRNEIYTGTLLQGKEEKLSYKVKKSIRKPQADWIRCENTHTPIITKEEYTVVDRLLRAGMRAGKGKAEAHPLSGFLFCADCNNAMICRKTHAASGEKMSFICGKHNRSKDCTRHTIDQEELWNVILQSIQLEIKRQGNPETQENLNHQRNPETQENLNYQENPETQENLNHQGNPEAQENLNHQGNSKTQENLNHGAFTAKKIGSRMKTMLLSHMKEEMRLLHEEAQRIQHLFNGLHEDRETGILTEEDYDEFRCIYSQMIQEINQIIERQKETYQKIQTGNAWKHLQSESEQPHKTERMMLLSLIETIQVYEQKRVVITFRFQSKR